MDLDGLLDAFAAGSVSREEVKRRLLGQSVVDIGSARLDCQRTVRTGAAEVVFCQGKTPAQVADIFKHLGDRNGTVLGTRSNQEQYESVAEKMLVRRDPVSRLLVYGEPPADLLGKIVVVSAGTADLPVAEEAAQTAEFYGSRVVRHFDCGVAGIHRLYSIAEELQDASAVVAVAGMDGALAAVVGGLCAPPVIGVPTSVGYGASFQGIGPLITMLNACAPGVSVVNIDNGFGAGYLAHMINARLTRASGEVAE
ncbi:MAG: nickel pincer cofactor biosynthesis protein LarB [Proteobacteria bacterium]|nr:nickel pincer cofactor biosynthesis protein LarB [Pseudomonadota bacterium]MBU1611406.1 nickel pincer cofactor biosynthesis protein LarB [Pseudomonadota bacterium]